MPRTDKKPATRRPSRAKAGPPATTQYEMRGLADQMPWGVFVPPDQVTAEVAIRVTAILACIRFLASALASMPCMVMRTLPNGRKAVASDVPCYDVLTRAPNAWQSQFEYMETTVYHTALHGNGYSRIVPGDVGFCSSLEPLHPSRMQVKRLDDNTLGYSYLYPNGKWTTFDQSQIIHYRWISDNGFMGLVPAELCGTSVALARKLDVAASSFWDNSGRPDVVVETQETIPEAAVAELRRQWREMYGGARKRGSAAILPKKVQVKTLESNSMEASQFQELRDSIVTEVARCFGVPSTLIGDRLMNRWSTVEQEFLTAQVFCLLPWQRRIESAIERTVLTTYPGTYFKLDNRGLLRADTAARTQLYQTMFNLGAISPNEIRDLEDLPLIEKPEANETYLQLGFAPIGVNAAKDPAAQAEPVPAEGVVLQDTALNGAQVAAMVQILAAISAGTLDQASGAALITAAFPTITDAQASSIVSGALAVPAADAARSLMSAVRAAAAKPEDVFELGSSVETGDAPSASDSSSMAGAEASELEQEMESSSDSGMELTGFQVDALLAILQKIACGMLTKEAGLAAIQSAFPTITAKNAQAMVDGVIQENEQPQQEAPGYGT